MVKQKGMTLIEVMIALVITTVGLLGALAMVGSLYSASAFNRNATEAMTLAQSTIEQANTTKVSLSDPDSDVSTANLNAFGTAGSGGGLYMFTRRVRWTTSADGSRRVCTVDVSWNDSSALKPDGTAVQHQVTMATERIP